MRADRLMALIGAVAIVSLSLKLLTTAPPPADADAVLNDVSAAFTEKGFREVSRIHVTQDGTYRAARFATIACPEAIIVLPLLRNAEFKGLIDAPRFPIHYLVGGDRYDAFPDLAVWQETLLARVGVRSHTLPPIAVVADPACVPDVAGLAE